MRTMLGLPSLARGPLLDMAITLRAPVMVSASALARWTDDGPIPPRDVFTPLERSIREAKGDMSPPTAAQLKRRARSWNGWNLSALDRIAHLGLDLNLDSGGFVALAAWGAHVWTPEAYVGGLLTHPAVTRGSAMDLCVEAEISPSDADTQERLARTVNLNWACHRIARDEGVIDKLMPVIQGRNADEYLACFDAISGMVAPGATIGLGSMCRRQVSGPNGIAAILDRLDRNLPADVRLHLFGIKQSGAEAAAAHGDRIDSIDSQAYGVRARRIANDRRRDDPGFSKTNAFCAGVMRDWYVEQQRKLASPRRFTVQQGLALDQPAAPRTVLDGIELAVRRQFNDLIAQGELDHDQIIGGRMLEEAVMEHARHLPPNSRMMDAWTGEHQLPHELRTNTAFHDEGLENA